MDKAIVNKEDLKRAKENISNDPSSGFVVKINKHIWYICFKSMTVYSLYGTPTPFIEDANSERLLPRKGSGMLNDLIQKGYKEYLDRELTRIVEEEILTL